jgi:hypothetical protein
MFPRFWGALVSNIVAPPSIRVKLIAKLHRLLRYPVADKRWSQHVSTAARLSKTTTAMSAEIKRLLSDSKCKFARRIAEVL